MICLEESRGIIGLFKYFPEPLYRVMGKIPVARLMKAEEIRIGTGKPVMIYEEGICYYILPEGKLTRQSEGTVRTSGTDVQEMLRLLCDGSVYAMEENISSGYITVEGGHRVGICGSCVIKGGKIMSIKDISYLNIRIAREVIGAAECVIDSIAGKGLKNTLIISPPGSGKTTLIRDICRILGNRESYSYKVGIADERGEIAAVYRGTPQNNVGKRTCVMDGCPKAEGMEMLLRSMGVDVVVTDEIGTEEDARAVQSLLNCGVCVIASVHGKSLEQVKKRENIGVLIGKGGFENIIVLENKEVRELVCFDN